jgi:cell fate (sporulation/competence/biofilm development) regulator YmcA (YheA/YmcA/DUF963 family)
MVEEIKLEMLKPDYQRKVNNLAKEFGVSTEIMLKYLDTHSVDEHRKSATSLLALKRVFTELDELIKLQKKKL